MAGDWIKMRVSLATHPKVMRVAEFLIEQPEFLGWSELAYSVGSFPQPSQDDERRERHAALRVTRYITVCALLKFWGYANEHVSDCERIDGLWPDDVDEIAGVPKFFSALESVGWVKFDAESAVMFLPNFFKYNVSAGSRGATNAERQRRYRERKKGAEVTDSVTDESNVTRNVTSNAREEKRREDIKLSSESFESFWSAWPKSTRKQGKSNCLAIWKKRGCESVAAEIIAHVEAMKSSEEWRTGFDPMPSTYLNQRRWDGATLPKPEPRQVAI